MITLSVIQAREIAGSLSAPGKFKQGGKQFAFCYSVSSEYCRTGSKLRDVPGSACFDCYCTGRGRYPMKNVVSAQEKRRGSLGDPRWIAAMVAQIRSKGRKFFRWFDAGDVQSIKNLNNIVGVARAMPDVKFWLPTQEYGDVHRWKKENGEFPPNLCVRPSARMVDPDTLPTFLGLPVSSQSTDDAKAKASGAFLCPATRTRSHCERCRKCWDPTVEHVSYRKQGGVQWKRKATR